MRLRSFSKAVLLSAVLVLVSSTENEPAPPAGTLVEDGGVHKIVHDPSKDEARILPFIGIKTIKF